MLNRAIHTPHLNEKKAIHSQSKRVFFEHTIVEIENNTTLTEECKRYGGIDLIHTLRQGKETICNGAMSSIDWYSMVPPGQRDAFGVLVMTGARVARATTTTTNFTLEIACIHKESAFERVTALHTSHSTPETKALIQNIRTQAPTCEHPYGILVFIDSNDYYNWWWFLVHLQNHFIAMAALEKELNDEPTTFVYLARDDRVSQESGTGLREVYQKLFGSAKTREVHAWIHPEDAYGCYSSILVVRQVENGSPILKNTDHRFSHCFSPIIAAMKLHLRRSMGVEHVHPIRKQVCWVSRDEEQRTEYTHWQKQRTVTNQTGLVAAMSVFAHSTGGSAPTGGGVNVVQLPFYPWKDAVSASIQIQRASHCDIIVGLHGAGLYVALGMERLSILELVPFPITNKNAIHLQRLVGGCYHGQIRVDLSKKRELDPIHVWTEVQKALNDCSSSTYVQPSGGESVVGGG